jgi:hypothetical protein
MPRTQRRVMLGMIAFALLMGLYVGSYALLRRTGYLVRGDNVELGNTMYAGRADDPSNRAIYSDIYAQRWNDKGYSRLPDFTLCFFSPLIQAELALRSRR